MNLADALEDVTSSQPYADRPAAHYIAVAQRVRARHRAALAGGVAAVVLVGAATVSAMSGGLQGSRTDGRPAEVATQGPPPTAPSPAPPAAPNAQVYRDMAGSGAHAGYNVRTGELVLDHGWQISEQLDSPWRTGTFGGPTPPTKSVALVVSDATNVQWILLDWESGQQTAGAIYDDDPGVRGFVSLAAYVDVEMALHQTRSTNELVAFSGPDTETLEPRNGITIIAQEPVTLRDGTHAVLAQLRVLDNDWYVVAKRTAHGATYVPVIYPHAGDDPGLTGFLAHVNDLVAKSGVS